jgi:DNA-binding NtrC family response regulator
MPFEHKYSPSERQRPHGRATVLVIDDNHELRATIADCLRDCDFDVWEAENADRAVALLQNGLVADIVVSDVLMAGKMDGIAFAHWIENHRPGVPVIFASGANRLDQAAMGISAVKRCLAKPFGITDLENAVSEVLDETRPFTVGSPLETLRAAA